MRALFLALAFLVACSAAPEPRFPGPGGDDLASATRRLEMDIGGIPVGLATAWLVKSDQYLDYWVTAGHACEEVYGYTLEDRHGKRAIAGLVADDDALDLCVLGSLRDSSSGRPLPLATTDPGYSSKVRYAGNPIGYYGAGVVPYFEGFYIGRDTDDESLSISIPAYPGASGSAVVDEAGRVIGVLVSVPRAWQEMARLVPYEALRGFLERAGI